MPVSNAGHRKSAGGRGSGHIVPVCGGAAKRRGAMRRLGSLTVAGLWLAMPCPAQAAGGAYAVDDADIGKPGSCQSESWISTATSHDFVGVVSPACVVTIGLPVEFTAVYQRGVTTGEWTTTPGGQAKIVPINNAMFALSLSAGLAWDSATRTVSGFVNMPLTLKLGKDFRAHVDAGWLHDSRVDVDYGTGGIGFEWDFVPKLSLQGEVFIEEGRQRPFLPDSITEPRTQLGLRYTPTRTVDLDFIYGRNLTGRGADWFLFGLTIRSQ
jgi:hypothetical protein